MASYEVTGPDGHKYRITAPDDMQPDAVLERFQREVGQQPVAANTPRHRQPEIDTEARRRQSGYDRMTTGDLAMDSATLGALRYIGAAGRAGGRWIASRFRGDREPVSYGDEYARERDVMQRQLELAGDEAGAMAIPAQVAGALVAAPGRAAASAVTRGAEHVAPSLFRTSAQSAGVGGAIGGVHGFNETSESWGDKAQNALVHGAGGAAVGAVLPPAIRGVSATYNALMAPVRRRAAAAAERSNVVADDFARADIPEFAPALGGDVVQGTASRLQGTVFGSSLRGRARESIEALETRIGDELSEATGGRTRTPAEAGTEARDFVRRNVERGPETIERDIIETMPAQRLDDISGVPPSPQQRMPPSPRVQPERPADTPTITADVYLDQVRNRVPAIPPREVPPSVPEVPRQPEISAPPEMLAAEARILGRQQAIAADDAALLQQQQATRRMVEETAERRGADAVARTEHRNAIARYNRLDEQRRTLRREYEQLENEYAVLTRQWDEMRPGVANQAQRAAESEAALRAAARTTALREQADTEAARATQAMRDQAVERARLTAEADATAETARLRAEAESTAASVTRLRQADADAAHQADWEGRVARSRPVTDDAGQVIAEPRITMPRRPGDTYDTQFDAAYEQVRRNEPAIQLNLLGRRATDTEPAVTTHTSELLNALALEARGAMRMPGYRPERLFEADGRVRPQVLDMARREFGEEIANGLRYLSERRATSRFPSSTQGRYDLRTTVGRAIENPPEGASPRSLKRLYDALNDDFARFAEPTAEAGIGHAQRSQVNALYRQFQQEIREPLRRIANIDDPVAAINMLMQATGRRGNFDMLRAFYRVVGDKGDHLVATSWLLHNMQEGGLRGFMQAYRNLSPDARRLMFQGNARAFGERLDTLARAGGHLERFANTADDSLARMAARPGNMVAGLLAYTSLPVFIKAAVTAEVASRILSSRWFGRWLKAVPVQKGPGTRQWDNHLNLLRNNLVQQFGVDQAAANMIVASSAQAAPLTAQPGPEERASMWEDEGPFYQERMFSPTPNNERPAPNPDEDSRIRSYTPEETMVRPPPPRMRSGGRMPTPDYSDEIPEPRRKRKRANGR